MRATIALILLVLLSTTAAAQSTTSDGSWKFERREGTRYRLTCRPGTPTERALRVGGRGLKYQVTIERDQSPPLKLQLTGPFYVESGLGLIFRVRF
jgi:hypothetical protein